MIGSLRQLLATLASRSVEVYEWKRDDIRRTRLPNGPKWGNLAKAHPHLLFTGWQLAHAVVKADFLVERDLLLPGLGFLLNADQILDFKVGPILGTVPGATASLNDFTRTSLCGRVGQGLSMLFAQSKGYAFVGHLASDPAVSSCVTSLGKQTKIADFLFETQSKKRMILESKASFAQPDNNPSDIKRVLKAALVGQVENWMNLVTPTASKGYAVYSCIRETGGRSPSALIFVDPPGMDDMGPVELSRSWVRRRNYAAWLDFMGFPLNANSLRDAQVRDGVAVELPVFYIGGREFAISSPQPWCDRLAVGLEVPALIAIEGAVTSDDRLLLEYSGDFADVVPAMGQNGSVFPDGSFFGKVSFTQFVGFRTFNI